MSKNRLAWYESVIDKAEVGDLRLNVNFVKMLDHFIEELRQDHVLDLRKGRLESANVSVKYGSPRNDTLG